MNRGRMIVPDLSDRSYDEVSRNISPAKVDRIMVAANGGDPADQADLAEEILEKNIEICAAWNERSMAVLGLKWHVTPGDDTPAAKKAAETLEKQLKNAGSDPGTEGLRALIADIQRSVIIGYSVNEILWGAGGSLLGFASVRPRSIDYMGGFEPKLNPSNAPLTPLEPGKFIYAYYRLHGTDPARGGLIRPLAWLHCFIQLGIKDLLSFTERYAMPMIIAKVSDESYDNERSELIRMIRNFGPNGGGGRTVSGGTRSRY